jgi:hypothetical protein
LQPADERRETVRERIQTIDGKTLEGGSSIRASTICNCAPATKRVHLHTVDCDSTHSIEAIG